MTRAGSCRYAKRRCQEAATLALLALHGKKEKPPPFAKPPPPKKIDSLNHLDQMIYTDSSSTFVFHDHTCRFGLVFPAHRATHTDLTGFRRGFAPHRPPSERSRGLSTSGSLETTQVWQKARRPTAAEPRGARLGPDTGTARTGRTGRTRHSWWMMWTDSSTSEDSWLRRIRGREE